MSKKLKYFSVLFFVFTLVFLIPSVSRVRGAETEAASRISQAENSLKAAYLSVLEAERVGGDVSELVAFLNTALEYYAEAERVFEIGEYGSAVDLADKAIDASNVVLETDISMIVVTEIVKEKVFRNQLYLSIGASCIIILFSVLGWKVFKGYYVRRIRGLSPEVVADES